MCKKENSICTECKQSFKPLHKRQVTCGDKNCIRSRKNRLRRKDEVEFLCQSCGSTTWSSNKKFILCGKKECRKHYVNEFNKAGRYKQKLQDRVKLNATVSGKYKISEIKLLIKMKLENKTHTEIALALKRILPNVDKKVRVVFKDDKFQHIIDEIRLNLEIQEKRENKKDISYWNKRLSQIWN